MNNYVSYACADGIARITLVDADHGNPIHIDQVRELHQAVRRPAPMRRG